MDATHFIGTLFSRASVLLSNAPKPLRKLIVRALLELLELTGAGGEYATIFAWAAYDAEFCGGANV